MTVGNLPWLTVPAAGNPARAAPGPAVQVLILRRALK